MHRLKEKKLQVLSLFYHIIQRRFFPSKYQVLFNNITEDIATHWSYADISGKKVLDLGADYGTTPEYFLHMGARKVIAVEGNQIFFSQLQEKFEFSSKVSCKNIWINSVEKLENLISDDIDIAKVDIEGAENYLLETSAITKIPVWLIEAHSDEISDKLIKHFQIHDFETYQIMKHLLKMVKKHERK